MNQIFSEKFKSFTYINSANQPRSWVSLSEIQRGSTEEGFEVEVRQHVIDNSYQRVEYVNLVSMIIEGRPLEYITANLSADVAYKNYENIKLLYQYYNNQLLDLNSINSRLVTTENKLLNIETDIIEIDGNVTPLTTQIATLNQTLTDLSNTVLGQRDGNLNLKPKDIEIDSEISTLKANDSQKSQQLSVIESSIVSLSSQATKL